MGIHRGPNPVNDGLVVGYDTGYGVADNSTATRFYPGAPTTNIVPLSLSNSSWFNEYSSGRTLRSETLFGQPVYEFKSNDGQIWISPFAFNSYDRSTNDLTLSVYAKNIGSSAASIGNYFGGDYSSDSLGNGNSKSLPADNTWRRYSWTRFSSAMAANYLEFRTANAGVVISCPQLEIGRLVTPVVSGTRSSTASLIDLKKTTDIDVSNVSFDSTGQPTFDGSDDYISIDVDSWIRSVDSVTIEGVVIIPSGASLSGGPWAILTDHSVNSEKDGFWWHMSLGGGYTYFRVEDAVSGEQGITFSGATPFASGNTYHIVTIVGLNSVKIYVNGVLSKSYTPTFNWANVSASHTASLFIGRTFPGYWLNSTNPVVKVYDVALTEAEIEQNYNSYKNRFDI